MTGNRGGVPPELEVARLYRLLNEGSGYDELLAFVERSGAVGWSAARERVVQDGLRLRLTQLFHARVNFNETREFVDAVAACIDDVRHANPALAERLHGFQLVAEQMLRRPGDVPSQLLLRDPLVPQLLAHLATSPAQERTMESLDGRFGGEGNLDVLLWPLLNINYIRKTVSGDLEVYELEDELAAYYQVAAEDPLGTAMPTPEPVNLVVPIQPIFDFLTFAYAGVLGNAGRYRVNVRTHRGVRHNRNWFSIDEFYFEERLTLPAREIRAAVLPRSAMVAGSKRNSLDVLPTNAFVGFHWMIARSAVPGRRPARIFTPDGRLAPVYTRMSEVREYLAGMKRVVVLLDEPMEPHARLVLGEVFRVDPEICFLDRREDNIARLAELRNPPPETAVLAISTGPMLAMADAGEHAVLVEFKDVVRDYRRAQKPYEDFAETIFHCAANINLNYEDWQADGQVRDVSYRIHLMMREVITSVIQEPGKFASFVEQLWAREAAAGPDSSSYAGELSAEAIAWAIRSSYIWIDDPRTLCGSEAVTWSDSRADLFWSHGEDFLFSHVMHRREEDNRLAQETLAQLLLRMEAQGVAAKSRDELAHKIRGWITHGSPNHAVQRMNLLADGVSQLP